MKHMADTISSILCFAAWLAGIAIDTDGSVRGVAYSGGVISSSTARVVLADFGLEDAKEDNHVPGGKVRNYWRPVADHLSGYECPCVDTEPKMVEDKGDYVWRGA